LTQEVDTRRQNLQNYFSPIFSQSISDFWNVGTKMTALPGYILYKYVFFFIVILRQNHVNQVKFWNKIKDLNQVD